MGGSANEEAIVAAAQRVIRERGREKLRLSAVAEAAGVSRQTLYRWFPTKEHLLAAITSREKELFDVRLRAALDQQGRRTDRLDVALRFLVSYLDEAVGPDAIGVDPGFALASLASALEPQAHTLVEVLGAALEEIPAVRQGSLTPHQAAGLLLRLSYSHYLLPHADPKGLVAQVRELVGLPRRRQARLAG